MARTKLKRPKSVNLADEIWFYECAKFSFTALSEKALQFDIIFNLLSILFEK